MEEEKIEFKPLEVSEREYRKQHKKDPKPDNPKEGRVLKGWSSFFFVMSVIFTALVASTFALPFIIVVFGLFSALFWICWIVIVTVFTLGMVWLSDDTKKFNQGWMDFNNRIFDVGNSASEFGMSVVTTLVITGVVFFLITWLLMIIGLNKDQVRKRHYKGMVIALGIITFLFIALSVISLIVVYNQK